MDSSLVEDDVSVTVLMNMSVSLQTMSISPPTVSMKMSPSASMSVVMEASTTPGGEVIPEPTTLPPVCSTDCQGKGREERCGWRGRKEGGGGGAEKENEGGR